MEASIRGIFGAHFKAWSKGRNLALHQHKAAFALGHCRTLAMGSHVQCCPRGHYATVQPNACRSRSCPRCSALARERWVISQQGKLLACEHYHLVFTLPHELLGLFDTHRRVMVEVLFRSVRETLMCLLSDKRHLGAEVGLVMTLHTWGGNLSHHPHLHCLLSGGGLNPQGRWCSTTSSYLLPVALVKALYRAKVLALLHHALNTGELGPQPGHSAAELHALLARLRQRSWHVRLKERYPHGHGVMKYLARYVKGGPISDSRIEHADEAQVTFRYRDHRAGRRQRMSLPVGAFLGRILWHLPEPYQHLVRSAGLYANRAVAKRERARKQLRQGPQAVQRALSWQTYLTQRGHATQAICPRCGGPLVVLVRDRHNQISNTVSKAVSVFVQQTDEVDIACEPRPP